MTLNCIIANTVEPEWMNVTKKLIGQVPSSLSSPDVYVLVEKKGIPQQRLDIYLPIDTYNFRIKAAHWGDWITVGCSNLVYLIAVRSSEIIIVPTSEKNIISDYFSDFWFENTFMLVVSACGLLRIEPNGHVLWRNSSLGLDGVVVDTVSPDIIAGEGEWDPPEGWQPFRICTTTGKKDAHLRANC